MSPQVINIDRYLCDKYKTLEWCGILFYEEEGTINEPDNYVINVKYLYPMDVGSPGSTSIENYDEVLDAIEQHPELETMRQGFIHSHNNMDTFFSGTDVTQLIDGAEDYDYFLSVITNNEAEYIARISFSLKMDVSIGANNYKVNNNNNVGYYECDVAPIAGDIDEFLINRIKEIDSNKTVYTYNTYKSSMNGMNSSGTVKNYWNDTNTWSPVTNIEPASFLPEQYLEMYGESLLDAATLDKHVFKDLIEISFRDKINDKLNKTQTKQKEELINDWFKDVCTRLTSQNVLSNFNNTKLPIDKYIINNLKDTKVVYKRSYDRMMDIINNVEILNGYHINTVYHAFVELHDIIVNYDKFNTSFAMIRVINDMYCTVLAHVAVHSDFNILQIQNNYSDIDVMLPTDIMEEYAGYIPMLSYDKGLSMPYNYYQYYD